MGLEKDIAKATALQNKTGNKEKDIPEKPSEKDERTNDTPTIYQILSEND